MYYLLKEHSKRKVKYMQLYPTIHIKNGKCFNPAAAMSDKQNLFTSSPVRLAKYGKLPGHPIYILSMWTEL